MNNYCCPVFCDTKQSNEEKVPHTNCSIDTVTSDMQQIFSNVMTVFKSCLESTNCCILNKI